jgi:hypothetical protein
MTDADFKERKALIYVWPNIHMLLCMFHVSLAWKNKMNELLGARGGSQIVKLRQEVKQYLRGILKQIKNMDSVDGIKLAIQNSQGVFQVCNIYYISDYLTFNTL